MPVDHKGSFVTKQVCLFPGAHLKNPNKLTKKKTCADNIIRAKTDLIINVEYL